MYSFMTCRFSFEGLRLWAESSSFQILSALHIIQHIPDWYHLRAQRCRVDLVGGLSDQRLVFSSCQEQ